MFHSVKSEYQRKIRQIGRALDPSPEAKYTTLTSVRISCIMSRPSQSQAYQSDLEPAFSSTTHILLAWHSHH